MCLSVLRKRYALHILHCEVRTTAKVAGGEAVKVAAVVAGRETDADKRSVRKRHRRRRACCRAATQDNQRGLFRMDLALKNDDAVVRGTVPSLGSPAPTE